MAGVDDDGSDGRCRGGDDRDYTVGYGRPPKHTRFQPGQSGNPRGRPRGKRGLRTELERVLNEFVSVREGDRVRSITKQEAVIRTTVNGALNNDPRARNTLIALIHQLGLVAPADDAHPEPATVPLSAEDAAILDAFAVRRLGAGPQDPDDDRS